MSWRPMTSGDLPDVQVLADTIHVDHPEELHVFAERLRLYPQGCAVLEVDGRLIGYALTHPWRYGEPPALNSHLPQIPTDATTYYIHDVALLPEARGKGYAMLIGNWLVDHAAQGGLLNLSLVAVNGSQPFWEKLGFQVAVTPSLEPKLMSYGPDAVLMVRHLTQGGR
jgi:GNAT superfamily N-acetyltransferase